MAERRNISPIVQVLYLFYMAIKSRYQIEILAWVRLYVGKRTVMHLKKLVTVTFFFKGSVIAQRCGCALLL